MSLLLGWVLAALIMTGLATPGEAAGNAKAARGLVASECVSCHEVPGLHARYGAASVNAPPFQAIADQPDRYPAARLRRFLQRPHFPMTKYILSPADIDNLVAFIESLRHPAKPRDPPSR